MSRLLRKTAPFLALAAACVATQAEAARVCSIVVQPWVRYEQELVFTGTALPDTAAAGVWTVPPGGGYVRTESVAVFGQRVRVADAFVAQVGGAEVVLVPWDAGGSCGAEPRLAGARFLETGRELFFALVPRKGAVRIFDLYARSVIYDPRDPLRGMRGHQPARGRALTLSEYASFHAALPTFYQWHDAPCRAAGGVYSWIRRHRALARRAPARQIIREMERELRAIRRDPLERERCAR